MAETHTRLTLEDISKEIHISRTTIYKVINNKGTVSEKTRETVLAALEKYDYVPNNNARNLALNKKYNIALINFESPDASYFATSIDCGIRQAIRDYGDHGLTIQSYTARLNHPDQQVQDIHQAYKDGIRHFIISAADRDLIASEVDWLHEKGCTIILLSKDLPDSPYDAFIGIDEYKGGLLAGEMMGKLLPNGGKLQILVARESASNIATIKPRLRGFLDKIALYPKIELLPVIRDLSGNQESESALLKALKVPNLSGIFDLTYHLDLVSKILQREQMKHIKLTGMDLFTSIEPYIKDNTIDAIIFQNLEAQTYLACKLLFEQFCYGKEIKKDKYYSKLEIIMQENLEYFVQ